MRIKTWICLPAFLWSFFANGQTTILGRVGDSTTKEPLFGVNIFAPQFLQGCTTEADGRYRLVIDEKNDSIILEISYLGYQSQQVSLINFNGKIEQDFGLVQDGRQLQTVTVTANKTAQKAQQTPMGISSLPAIQLKRSGAQYFREYASGVSNLAFDPQGAGLFGRFDNGVSIRGIAGKNTTAMYLDETPLPENLDPRLLNLRRVEVLKGPQGTLYGSRNMGGAVKVVTNLPDASAMNGSLDLSLADVKEGDFDYSLEGVINMPLGKKAALQWAGFSEFLSGVFDRSVNPDANILNLGKSIEAELPSGESFIIKTDACPGCTLQDTKNIDDQSNYGFQASLGLFPTKKITIMPRFFMQHQSGDGFDFAEGEVGNFEQVRAAGVQEYFEDDWKLYALSASIELGRGKLVSSISFLDRFLAEVDDNGESVSHLYGLYDGQSLQDFFAGTISKLNNSTQLTQELRFESKLGGRLNFTTGLFYMDGRESERWFSDIPGAGPYISLYVYEDPKFAVSLADEEPPLYEFEGSYLNREMAFFGEAYFAFSKKLAATLGFRLFKATLGIDSYETGFIVDDDYFEVAGESSESGVIPKFNLSYDLGNGKMLYANIGKGYRLGDLNEIVPEVFCGEELRDLPGGTHPRTFRSDHLWSYELGMKSTWADGKLTLNAAIFYNDWQNLQQNRSLDCGYNYTSNVGSAHTAGLELDFRSKPFPMLEMGGGLGLLRAVVDKSGPHLDAESGDRILFTPPISANAYAQFSKPLNGKHIFYLRFDVQYVGRRMNTFSPEEAENAYLIFAPYAIVHARAGLVFSHHEVSIFVENLTNTAANYGDIFSVATDYPGRPRFATNRPRTIGLGYRLFF